MTVGAGEREGGGCGGEVVHAVEKGDNEEEGGESAEDDLGKDGAREVATGVRKFLGHVGDAVGGADGEGSVQHSSQKGDAAAPAGGVVEIFPDGGVAGVFVRHGGHHDDCDDSADDNHE